MPLIPLADDQPAYWGALQQELNQIQAAIIRAYYIAGSVNFPNTSDVLTTLQNWFAEVENAQQFVASKIP